MVLIMIEIIEWIERSDPLVSLDADLQRTKYSQFCSSFANVCQCEIQGFRLQIMIELMVLSGLVSKGHHMADHAYPVKGRGSYKHLDENNVLEKDMMVTMELLGERLGISRHSLQENILCEARPGRGDVWDVFYFGQSLFLLRPFGSEGKMGVCCKEYGTKEWVPL
jgi:hypothetical protein